MDVRSKRHQEYRARFEKKKIAPCFAARRRAVSQQNKEYYVSFLKNEQIGAQERLLWEECITELPYLTTEVLYSLEITPPFLVVRFSCKYGGAYN